MARASDYASDTPESERFEGPAADAILATYGAEPIGRLSLRYGHHAAKLPIAWHFYVVRYDAGTWTALDMMVHLASQSAMIVGTCNDGSPLWEFRL